MEGIVATEARMQYGIVLLLVLLVGRVDGLHAEVEDFDENDETAAYSIPYIFEDIDFRRQFYDEINDHFDWVRDELEEHDIFVLKSTPIY